LLFPIIDHSVEVKKYCEVMIMQTVSRLTRVLSELQAHPEGIGVLALAERIDLPASSLHRLLQSLCEERLVWQDLESRRYSLGVRLLELGWPILNQPVHINWRKNAHILLSDLSLSINHQVFLGLLVQDAVLIVETIHPSAVRSTPVSIPSLTNIPLHCGSTAKAILAFLPNHDAERIVHHCTFRPYTMHTLATKQELLDHLDQVRQQGYALCNEEFEHGALAISVPVLDQEGRAFASLGVGPLSPKAASKSRRSLVGQLKSIASTVGGGHPGLFEAPMAV
jgi:IclR family KDG regulon transcriptional repressor